MISGIEGVTIFSEKAEKLANFYKDVVGLKLTFEAVMGEHDEEGYMFDMENSSNLYILDHSEIKGVNTQPKRTFFNLEVDDIEKEFNRLKQANVKIIAEIYHVESYGFIAIFEDVDGNYFQFVQTKAKAK